MNVIYEALPKVDQIGIHVQIGGSHVLNGTFEELLYVGVEMLDEELGCQKAEVSYDLYGFVCLGTLAALL
jgi:hypothetical protein